MMEPPDPRRIAGTTACIPRRGPVRFTARTRSHVARSVSMIPERCEIPALFINTSDTSVLLHRNANTVLPGQLIGNIEMDISGVPAPLGNLVRRFAAGFIPHVGQYDSRA